MLQFQQQIFQISSCLVEMIKIMLINCRSIFIIMIQIQCQSILRIFGNICIFCIFLLIFINKEYLKYMRTQQKQPQRAKQFQYFRNILQIRSTRSSKNGNEYSILKRSQKMKDETWPNQFIMKTIKNIQINDNLKLRLQKIKSLPYHDNIVRVRAVGYNRQKKQVYVLSDYFNQSQNLQQVLTRGLQVNSGIYNNIFYQVVVAMLNLQQKGISHLRLNPSSILVKFQKQKKELLSPIVRVCDFGFTLSGNSDDRYCLHPDIINNGVNPYHNQRQKNTAYDIWAFCCIIYYTYKQRKPFYQQKIFSKQAVFNPQLLTNYMKWLNQSENRINGSSVLERLLRKSWQLQHSQVRFDNWRIILQYFEKTYSPLTYEMIPINYIYDNHLRAMFLFLRVYNLLKQQHQFKLTRLSYSAFQQNDEVFQKFLKKQMIQIIKLCEILHKYQFKKYFSNRMTILPFIKQKHMQLIQRAINAQISELSNRTTKKVEQSAEYQSLIQNILSLHSQMTTIYGKNPLSQSNYTLKLLKKFMTQAREFSRDALSVIKNNSKNQSDILLILYKNQFFNTMAVEDFGFVLAQYNQFES